MIKKKRSNTCIAALKTKSGKILMGADRRCSWDFSQCQVMPRPKINKRNGVILAGTGDSYLCTLFVDIMEIPNIIGSNTDKYMHGVFFDAVYNMLIMKGMGEEHNLLKIPGDSDVEILVVIYGKLYQVIINNPDPTSTMCSGLVTIDELNLPFATGCGGQAAWNAIKAFNRANQLLKDIGQNKLLTDKQILLESLVLAAENSPGCDDNIDIIGE